MSKHTPEPWTFESEPQYCSEIFGSDGMSVCTFVDDPSGVDVDRILSCVNACAGMEDPAAEIAAIKQQRDELLAALQGMIDIANDSQGVAGYHLNGEVADWGAFEEWQAACGAIAKAKGGAS